MKTKFLAITAFTALIVTLILVVIVSSCTKTNNSNSTNSTSCKTTGTTANIGGSNGSTYGFNVSSPSDEQIQFDNINGNFNIQNTSLGTVGYGTIMDVGPQSCLDFTYSGTPTAKTVAEIDGHGYVGIFLDGHIIKFIAGTYNQGIISVTYSTLLCPFYGTLSSLGTNANGVFNVDVGNLASGTCTCHNPGDADQDCFINFDNTKLNFSVSIGCKCPNGYRISDSITAIMDVGPQSCLDFTYSGTLFSATVPEISGHGYVGKFENGHSVKFIADTYSGGIVIISYLFQ